MGGEGGIRKLLGNSNLGVQELFTKLLQEPLYMCHSTQRKLVVVDALDETQYESREDFLDLIMNRLPVLPHWLVFFITSRPENTVQLSLKKYNPCVRICAGNVEHNNFYQQHAQDIKLFLTNSVDFSRLPFSVNDLATKCNGSFLYAFYIAKDLNSPMQSGKSFQLVDLFPGDFDNFLRKNFERVFQKVGSTLFKKLFGCAIAAPAPLPISFISYVLQREKLKIPEQHVLDALSLFMVLSKTFTFVHRLIPAWLTDEDKARELFIDRNIEANYLKDVIHTIIFGFIREQSQDVSLIKRDLLDYVLRVGIRFLSGFSEKNSLETVFSCLTSFKYIESRIQSSRIEIFSLVEGYKLLADCHFQGEIMKKEILFWVCSALEINIYVLLECPYFLHSCLQNACKVVQENVVLPGDESTTRLQLDSISLRSKHFHAKSNFTVSPDGKLFAERHGKHISLFDSSSLKCVDEFSSCELESNLVSKSKCLEFSPDGKFLFFGRLDRWFSLKDEDVREFLQFSRIDSNYEWGSFTLDRQWIVVKPCNFSFQSNYKCCWLCLLNSLCLWAAEEIVQSRETDESETICGCFPDRLLVQIQPSAEVDHHSPVPAMRILLHILRRTHRDMWCSLFEKLQLNYPFEDRCSYCRSRMMGETPSLTVLRDFVIDHYNKIFKYQVWNVQTGRSALEQAFSSGLQLSPFTYLCHLGTALEKCGVLFSGIDKSLSLCNIALLSTVCHHLFFFECFHRTFVGRKFRVLERLERFTELERLGQRVQLEEIKQFKKIFDCSHFSDLRGVLQGETRPKRFAQFKQLVHLSCYHLESEEKFKFVEAFHFGTKSFINAPLELQNLPDVKEESLFTSMLPCVSPDGKWIAIRLEGDDTTVQLYRGQLQHQHHPFRKNLEHVVNQVKHFAFTNDSVLFLYLTVQRSLRTLSLATGTILTSVSGVRPIFCIPEKPAGYRFQGADEETIIFVKDFPTVFLSSFLSFIGTEPMQVAFASADAILVLYSDSTLALKENDGTAFASETSLTHPFGGSQQVKKGQFSPDGKVIVTHQGTKILLYRTVQVSNKASPDDGECPDSVFEANDDFIVLHFTFSADSTLLLFCIRRNIGLAFFVWNVLMKVLSASLDSPGLMSEDCCCCFSLDNKELIICSEFFIGFWDHTSHPCCLLRKIENDVPFTEVGKFTHCTVSPENGLLAYCIADRILLCPLTTSTDQSIRQLPRAHLGKVQFCQFLKGNRYLISYGVDGTMFLWDLSEWKAVAFAKIAQGRESIVSMAVSARGDKVVCVTSFGRLNVIKPCGLKDVTLSKLPLPKEMGSGKVTEAFGGQARELTESQNLQCPGNTEDLDAAELRIEEMEFFALSDDNEYSDEDSDELLD